MSITYRNVPGLKDPVLEDLCPLCLYILRASLYDGGPHNELDTICELGIEPDEEASD